MDISRAVSAVRVCPHGNSWQFLEIFLVVLNAPPFLVGEGGGLPLRTQRPGMLQRPYRTQDSPVTEATWSERSVVFAVEETLL